MLKGKTIIELTDVNTGETEKLEDTNLVTNALTQIYECIGHCKKNDYLFEDWTPAYKYLLGGLLLFDRQMPENVNTIFPSAPIKLTGCGVYGKQNPTANICRGDFNVTESEVNLEQRYVKYVYDFATSQANGPIGCVCLTNINGGYTSYGHETAEINTDINGMEYLSDSTLQYVNPSYTGADTADRNEAIVEDVTEFIFAIDYDADVVYYFKIIDETHISIVKRRAFLKTVSVIDDIRHTKPLIEEIALQELTIPLMGLSYWSYNFDPDERKLYIYTRTSYFVELDTAMTITEISFDDWSINEYTWTNQTNLRLTYSSRAYFIHRGYMYATSYDSPQRTFKIAIDNPADVTEIQMLGIDYISGYPLYVINGFIYYEASSSSESSRRAYILDTELNTASRIEACYMGSSYYSANYTPFIGRPLYWFLSRGDDSAYTTLLIPSNYLATINNLDSPVTKTADKTMKVTYIIQEE